MIERRFGRRCVLDTRDRAYSIPLVTTKRTSRYWYDGRWFGDQGATPHCVGFAYAHWLVSAPVVNYLDPHGLYAICKLIDGDAEDGTTLRSAAKVLTRLGVVAEYRWATTVKQLANAVLERGPVVVGTNWYERMGSPGRDGQMTIDGAVLGGHAYLISGVDVAKKSFRVKNSWGEAWGKSGRAYLSFAAMTRLLGEDGEACLALERPLVEPQTSGG